jgi:hypothetical protein
VKIVGILVVSVLLAGCVVAIGGGKEVTTVVTEKHGTLSVRANVEGAEVYVDGALYGEIEKAYTQQDFVVAGGTHDLLVKKAGFASFHTTITVCSGGTAHMAVHLEPVEPAA